MPHLYNSWTGEVVNVPYTPPGEGRGPLPAAFDRLDSGGFPSMGVETGDRPVSTANVRPATTFTDRLLEFLGNLDRNPGSYAMQPGSFVTNTKTLGETPETFVGGDTYAGNGILSSFLNNDPAFTPDADPSVFGPGGSGFALAPGSGADDRDTGDVPPDSSNPDAEGAPVPSSAPPQLTGVPYIDALIQAGVDVTDPTIAAVLANNLANRRSSEFDLTAVQQIGEYSAQRALDRYRIQQEIAAQRYAAQLAAQAREIEANRGIASNYGFSTYLDSVGGNRGIGNFQDILLSERFNGLARTQRQGLGLLEDERRHIADLVTREFAGGLSDQGNIFDVQRLQAIDNPFAYLAFRRFGQGGGGGGNTPPGVPPNGPGATDQAGFGRAPSTPFRQPSSPFAPPGVPPSQYGFTDQSGGFDSFDPRFGPTPSSSGFTDPSLDAFSPISFNGFGALPQGQTLPLPDNSFLNDPALRELYDVQLAVDAPTVRGQDLSYILGQRQADLNARQQYLDLYSDPAALGAFQYFGGGKPAPGGFGSQAQGSPTGAQGAGIPPGLATRQSFATFGRLRQPEQGFRVGVAAARGFTPDDFALQLARNTPNSNRDQRRTAFSLA